MARASALLAACVASVATAQSIPQSNTTLLTRACRPGFDAFPFCNTSLPVTARVADLIGRLKPSDIPPLLTARHGGKDGPSDNISRIGVPEYDWGVNCLHGVQTSCTLLPDGSTKCPTSFPNPVNFGFTWNRSLAYGLGAVIATELRALWLAGATEASGARPHAGLDCWSPNINLNRDPRWGRNCETPSEDPFMNGEYGKWHTKGLQEGEDPAHVKTAVTLKHWDAYSLEDSDGFTRYNFNAVVSKFALYDSYFPAFRAAVVDGNARGVMCSYNAVNGVPTCASSDLVKALRGQWGFTGYITSDSDAVNCIFAQHHYVANGQEATCVALVNGTCDINSGNTYETYLLPALEAGVCGMEAVNASLARTLQLRFELGLFDPPEEQPYWNVPPSEINTQAAQDLNLLATLSGLVLLRNDGGLLPLPTGKRIAVIGPHAQAAAAFLGNYLGQICPDNTINCVTPLNVAIAAANVGGSTQFAQGCAVNSTDASGIAAAVALAKASDYVILAIGIDGSIEGESHDRTAITLPGLQNTLASAVAAAGKPTVLVAVNGGTIDITEAQAGASAVLEVGYPGFLGAQAIAMTLFGQNDHLGGKLTYTMYPAAYTSQISMTDMELDDGVGRGYRYYTGPSLYPFGHGLSLTTFSLSPQGFPGAPSFVAEASPSTTLNFSVAVKNTGAVTGDEVVQVYMVPVSIPSQPTSRLLRQLVDYERVHLGPGETTVLTFTVTSATFRVVDKASGDVLSAPGTFRLLFTNGVAANVTSAMVTVSGAAPVVAIPFPY